VDYVARTPEQLAYILKSCRTQQGLTQGTVAARVGIKQGTVSVLEADTARARIETLYKLLSALGVELVIRERASAKAAAGKPRREW
jgi:HTH-type transcriptional regulator / antitoxin HipB